MIIKELHPLIEYLRQHPHVGMLFTFLVAFVESLPLLGTVVPGTITMTAVGFLIGTAALPALLTLGIASFAALSGDAIGFAIGYWYNEGLRNVWPFKKYPKWLTMGEDFFHKHGGKSIIIGRFIGPVRSTVPMIAGLLQFTWFRFFIAAIPSAALWAIAYTVPGIMLGALSKEVPHGEMTKFLLSGIGAIAVVWFLFWVIEHFFVQLARGINKLTDKCWRYFSRPKHGNWLIRLITNQQNPDDHHQLTLFIFACLSAVLFLILLVNVRLHTVLTHWNAPIFHLLQSIHTSWLTNSLIVITIMGTPKTMILLGIMLTIGFGAFKQWRASAHMLAAVFLSSGAVYVFKSLSHSLRPQGFYIVAKTSSFPSGHTTLSFVVISFFTFLMAETLKKSVRWIPYTLATLFIIAVAFSRLYLGAHWFTDIIGSTLLGLSIFFACIISYHRMPNESSRLKLSPQSLALIMLITFGCTFGTQLFRMYQHDQMRYKRVWPTVAISKSDWWNAAQKHTPTYRNNRLGDAFQPFNVQWLGAIQDIKKTLLKANWKTPASKLELNSAIKRFASYQAEYHMPLLPWLYQNKPPVLIMIKHVPNHKMILEFRLWQSGITITNSKQPLWIGAVDVRLPPKKLLSIKDRSKVALIENMGSRILTQDIALLPHKTIQTTSMQKNKNSIPWDGQVLLVISQ